MWMLIAEGKNSGDNVHDTDNKKNADIDIEELC